MPVTIHLIRRGYESVVLLIFCQNSVVPVEGLTLNNRRENKAVHIKCPHEESLEVVTETDPISPVDASQHNR